MEMPGLEITSDTCGCPKCEEKHFRIIREHPGFVQCIHCLESFPCVVTDKDGNPVDMSEALNNVYYEPPMIASVKEVIEVPVCDDEGSFVYTQKNVYLEGAES